ncbi:MAG: histidine utilization repressor [Betaproteobacteria bacterium]|jgi:GntR family histidine utilization transcriptional repressor|nr:histidine utilization repressor [Betaproteobacteria bacterium]
MPPRKPRPAVPPYARIRDDLKRALARGRYPPGARMPSEAELVRRYGVSRMTVTRALRELSDDGLVQRVQGAGTFAAQPHRVASQLWIRDIHEEILARGNAHEARVRVKRAERAAPAVAERLGLAPGGRVFHTLIVHCENGVPLQCEDRYVNPAAAPGYLDADFAQVTPTRYLLDVAPLWEAQYSIAAARPTRAEAALLGIDPQEPCLVVVRRTETQHLPITVARLVHPGSRYLLEGSFKP